MLFDVQVGSRGKKIYSAPLFCQPDPPPEAITLNSFLAKTILCTSAHTGVYIYSPPSSHKGSVFTPCPQDAAWCPLRGAHPHRAATFYKAGTSGNHASQCLPELSEAGTRLSLLC